MTLPGNKGTVQGMLESARKGTVGDGAAGGIADIIAAAVCSAAFSVMRAMVRSCGRDATCIGGATASEVAAAADVGTAFGALIRFLAWRGGWSAV